MAQNLIDAEEENYAVELSKVFVNVKTETDNFQILKNVEFKIQSGSVVALAGESGSGKSTAMLAALNLLPGGVDVEGYIRVLDHPILELSSKQLRATRANEARVIFQDPWSSLHPMKTIGKQLIESVKTAKPNISREEARALGISMLSRVGIPDPERRMKSYPHQLSGGQLQRVAIAMALVASPKVLFCDEPTTALDVTTQQQILDLLQELRELLNITIVIATHNIDVIRGFADDLIVMYGGTVVEIGPVNNVLNNPKHPYTWALLQADPNRSKDKRLEPLHGRPPSPAEKTPGCNFADRCVSAQPICRKIPTKLQNVDGDHKSSCTLLQIELGLIAPEQINSADAAKEVD